MLFLKALFGLFAYDVLTTFRPFRALYASAKKYQTVVKSADQPTIDRICSAVNYACAWYPKQARCLQRSFVTTRMLRKHGIPAQMLLGAQKFPFKAHAWVEVNGRVINENSDVRSTYAVWDKC
jgi:hypothetical protein